MIQKWETFHGGGKRLDEELKGEIKAIAEATDNLGDKEAKNAAAEKGWKTSESVIGEFNWKFDAYKDRVAIEFERGDQTKARWNWIKFELANREVPEIEDVGDIPEIDLGILIVTEEDDYGGANMERCINELNSEVFDGTLEIEVPMVVAEFDTSSS